VCDDVTNTPRAGDRLPFPVGGRQGPQQRDQFSRHRTKQRTRIEGLEIGKRHLVISERRN
jgi:hypothetical protein